MSKANKTWRNILYICVLLTAGCLLFHWYSTANNQRIEKQNLNYAMDSAKQTSHHIKSEFDNSLLRMRNYSYLLGSNTNRPEIDAEILKGMEENVAFDAICFTNADGLNLASDGQTNDSRDRNYFVSGMQGKSGLEVVESRLSSQMMAVFYAPVEYDGETIGVLLGMYFAEEYLQDMLHTSYFGETADAFLCTSEGRIIANSGGNNNDQLLPDILRDFGSIDSKTADAIWEAFKSDTGDASFMCAPDSLSDNLCLLHIPNSEYILVQAFPKSVTQAMVREANQAGMILQLILICLFAVYIFVLLVHNWRQRNRLQKQNIHCRMSPARRRTRCSNAICPAKYY